MTGILPAGADLLAQGFHFAVSHFPVLIFLCLPAFIFLHDLAPEL
jgi:hypothetical protein